MRITLGVDALGPNPGGIGRYTWELCRGLTKFPDIDLSYYARGRYIDDPARLTRGEPLKRQYFRGLRRRLDRRALRRSLFHGTNYFLPLSVEGVITVHDLSVFKYPETHPPERLRQFDSEFHRSLKQAKHVITDTETVRDELISYFDVDTDAVTAVPLGVDDRFRPQTAGFLRKILAPLGLSPDGYGLCVSTLEPRKKISELAAAWRHLPPEIRDQFPLVLAGGAGWLNDELGKDIERGIAEGWLRFLGFVDEQLLPALYAGARLFVYPSIYEGFGLPPLEAMASGTPTIVAARSCLPEVCGDAVRYIDPEDPSNFLAQILAGLGDDEWRAEASRRGPPQASKFSWDRCAEETVRVYRKVVAL